MKKIKTKYKNHIIMLFFSKKLNLIENLKILALYFNKMYICCNKLKRFL